MVSEYELGTKDQSIDQFVLQFENLSDEQLHREIEKSGSGSSKAERIAASLVLHQRRQEREKNNHAELLAEVKRPHWRKDPLFWVSSVAMIASCVAAYFAVFPASPSAPQVLQSAPAFATPQK